MIKRHSCFFYVTLFALTFALLLIPMVLYCVADVDFSAQYFYVYYRMNDDAQSALSLSEAVQSYGGAGYIIESGNCFYVTVACYYSQSDADIVCAKLQNKNLNCKVLALSKSGGRVVGLDAHKKREVYSNYLSTLHSLSIICYQSANAIDLGEISLYGLSSIVSDVKTALGGLAKTADCFESDVNYLIAQCDDVSSGDITSANLRKLQIAITDCVVNAKIK